MQLKKGNEEMKKRTCIFFIFFIFFMLSMWGGKVYARSIGSNLFSSGTSFDFCLRVKVQLLPLYLVFPNLDLRDEGNKPVEKDEDLFLGTKNYRDNILNIWGVIRKRAKIGDIKLAVINLNKLQIIKSSNDRRHLDAAVFFFKDDLSLKLQVILC